MLLIVVPGNNCLGLLVYFQTFAPLELGFDRLLIQEFDLDVGSLHINLRGKFGRVLSLIIEIKDRHSIDSGSYQERLFIVEDNVVDESDC